MTKEFFERGKQIAKWADNNMTKDEVLMKALGMSLIELLRSVPKNARLIVDNADGMSSRSHPVGYLCHKAAEALAQPAMTYEDGFAHGYEAHRAEQASKEKNT